MKLYLFSKLLFTCLLICFSFLVVLYKSKLILSVLFVYAGEIVAIFDYKFCAGTLSILGFVFCAANYGTVCWVKQHHDTIHSSRKKKTTCKGTWHSCQKFQSKNFRVFGCQSRERFIFILMKTKHPIHINVLGMSV